MSGPPFIGRAQRRLADLGVEQISDVPAGYKVARFGLSTDLDIAIAAAFDQFEEQYPAALFRVAKSNSAVGILARMAQRNPSDGSRAALSGCIDQVRGGNVLLMALIEDA